MVKRRFFETETEILNYILTLFVGVDNSDNSLSFSYSENLEYNRLRAFLSCEKKRYRYVSKAKTICVICVDQQTLNSSAVSSAIHHILRLTSYINVTL